MPTSSNLKDSKVKFASKLLKKDQEFSPISPQFIKDLRDKTLLQNPLLKLSINDYKLMCDNKTILNMMSLALDKPKAKLAKFCKYISIFEENIHKSPRSIAYKINGPITNLPKEIRSVIIEKLSDISEFVLLDCIDINKIKWESLCENPNAIDLLKKNQDKINWAILSRNPNAIDLLIKLNMKILRHLLNYLN